MCQTAFHNILLKFNPKWWCFQILPLKYLFILFKSWFQIVPEPSWGNFLAFYCFRAFIYKVSIKTLHCFVKGIRTCHSKICPFKGVHSGLVDSRLSLPCPRFNPWSENWDPRSNMVWPKQKQNVSFWHKKCFKQKKLENWYILRKNSLTSLLFPEADQEILMWEYPQGG